MMIWTVLAWYIDNVRPGEQDSKKPFYFFVLPNYWGFGAKSAPNVAIYKHNVKKTSSVLPDMDKDIVHEHQACQGGARALDNLTVSCEAGNVLRLLGHNGAGKTTAISVMTVATTITTTLTATVTTSTTIGAITAPLTTATPIPTSSNPCSQSQRLCYPHQSLSLPFPLSSHNHLRHRISKQLTRPHQSPSSPLRKNSSNLASSNKYKSPNNKSNNNSFNTNNNANPTSLLLSLFRSITSEKLAANHVSLDEIKQVDKKDEKGDISETGVRRESSVNRRVVSETVLLQTL